MEKKTKTETTVKKPKYNMWQNGGYMIALSLREKESGVPLLCLVSALLSVTGQLLQLYVVPVILSAVEQKTSLPALLVIIGFFTLSMMLCAALSSYVSVNQLFGRIQVRCSLIAAINRKAAVTSYPNTGDEDFRKLLSKSGEATAGNSQASEAIWTTLTDLTANLLGFAAYLTLLLTLNVWIVLTVALTSAASYFINRRVSEYEYRHRDEVAAYGRELSYLGERAENVGAAKDIRIFGLLPWLRTLSKKAMAAYSAFYHKSYTAVLWGRVADLLLTFLRNSVAYAILIRAALSDGLDAADFLLYFSAVEGFATWIGGCLENLTLLHRQSLDISTIRECLEYPEPFTFEGGKPLSPSPDGRYEIELRDVSFRYPGSDKEILSHIDLTLRAGEKLAVVGLNGAGKTTLVKLLCGFYDPTEGQVLLSGQDIRRYDRRDYYRLFSAVFQDYTLLAGSVAVNIAQSEDKIDMERVKQCAEMAGIAEKIASLSDGYGTLLNRTVYEEAVMLSGGEEQRLMLARALYKNAPIVILDEPTAALDPISEAELYQKYGEMTQGRSSLYISHRLASTRFCDRIIRIEDGRIAEEGTHDELLAAGGEYARLFEVQRRYYRKEAEVHEENTAE